VEGSAFEEEGFFRAIQGAGVRALLIGRRALIALGAPVLTADYDLWAHVDDIEALNRAAVPFGLAPTRTPDEARKTGRYVLEKDERVDVLVARSVPAVDGVAVRFDDLWTRRQSIELSAGVALTLPSLADLIQTKRFGGRPRDRQDIEYLKGLLAEKELEKR
jgi:hypothetical protein